MIRDLPLLGAQAKAEPRHDPWPPTWRLPSGAIQVEASFKEPGRQKLVDKATKAVAFLALAFIVLGHEHWPWPDLVALALDFIARPGPTPISEQAAAWSLVAVIGVSAIVGTFRLLLAALGLDQGQISCVFAQDHVLIEGRAFERQAIKGFELEPHRLGKFEGHNEKRLGQATSLYYRDAFTIILRYDERRIEIAHVLGRQRASALLARFQKLEKHSIGIRSDRRPTAPKRKPSVNVPSQRFPTRNRMRQRYLPGAADRRAVASQQPLAEAAWAGAERSRP